MDAMSERNSFSQETVEKYEKIDAPEEPKVNYRGLRAMPYIMGNETFEKLGAIGTMSNLLVYMTVVFNMKSITAATLINVLMGTTNFATLPGAFLSDTYFGRYKTLGFGTIASFVGLLVIALTAAIPSLHPPPCTKASTCIEATAWQMAVLLTGFGLLVIGAGCIRPCNLAFGVDQFNPNTRSGKRGIDSFFNWYFFTISFAQMISVTGIVYVQSKVSWGIGLGIPAFLMLLACVFFYVGTYIYVKVKPSGSPMTSVSQVIVVAIKKRRLKLPEQPWLSLFSHISPISINSELPHTDQFRYLDKAAIVTPEDKINTDGSAANPWKLCSMQQVEEVKCLMRVIPIWASAIIYHCSTVQQDTYVVFQAIQSNRYFGNTKFQIPAASYMVVTMLSLTIWVPIYDRIVVPFLRRITRKEAGITILQRMGIGIFLSVLTSFVAAFIEKWRKTQPIIGIDPRKGGISSMSALWLIPQLSLAGLADAFTAIGQVEFYYKQFPENMRSIAGSLYFCGLAAASYLSGFLVSIVHRTTAGSPTGNWLPEDLNKGRLDYFYYVVASLGVMNFVYYLVCAKWYTYKGSTNTSPAPKMVEVKSEKPHV